MIDEDVLTFLEASCCHDFFNISGEGHFTQGEILDIPFLDSHSIIYDAN